MSLRRTIARSMLRPGSAMPTGGQLPAIAALKRSICVSCFPFLTAIRGCQITSVGGSTIVNSATFLTSGNGSLLPISIHFTTVGSSANPHLAM